jgi:hypothetical protein
LISALVAVERMNLVAQASIMVLAKTPHKNQKKSIHRLNNWQKLRSSWNIYINLARCEMRALLALHGFSLIFR